MNDELDKLLEMLDKVYRQENLSLKDIRQCMLVVVDQAECMLDALDTLIELRGPEFIGNQQDVSL